MSDRWRTRPERGSIALVQALAWLSLRVGRPVARWFLYPICFYFIIFSRGTRRISRNYLARALRRPVRWRDVFRHYHAFASTIHDRVYLLSGQLQCFTVRTEGASTVESLLHSKRGFIVLGSHLGSFEVLRAKGLFEKKLPISVVMHEGAASNLNSVLHGLCPDLQERIIPPGKPDTMLTVKERLDNGEVVGILADRLFSGDKTTTCTFLGSPTSFPDGPFHLAALLQVPVVLFFGLYEGGRRYLIHFEPFADPILLDRARRAEMVHEWVQRYVSRLEHYCLLYPYNWFNFYELSNEAVESAVPAGNSPWAERHS